MSNYSFFVVSVRNPSIRPGRMTRITQEERDKLKHDQLLFANAANCLKDKALYFHFRDGDEKGKAVAKKQAEEAATKFSKQLFIDLQVCEGFFL